MKLKNLLPFFCSAAFLFSASSALAATAAANASDADFQPLMAKSMNCFSGPFQSYDSFIGMLLARNQDKPKVQAATKANFSKAEFEQYQQQLHCEKFIYDVDGVKVLGYLIQPKNAAAKSLPVLVYNRGGNGPTGQLIFGGTILKQLMPLAAQGYVVLASNYRGNHNPMKLPPEQIGKDEFGGADVADVLAFKTLLNQVPAANPEHVAMMGHSRGGMQTWLAAKQWPELDALVIIAGVTDLEAQLQERPDMENVYKARISDYASNKTAALEQRSVSTFLPQIRADLPVLIVHGDKDDRVNVSNAHQIAQLLSARKQPHQLLIVPGGDHSLRQQMPELRQQMDQFIRAQLR
jgi:dipeptidyl aminopeptidase/acylaminoacyl peptidase